MTPHYQQMSLKSQ